MYSRINTDNKIEYKNYIGIDVAKDKFDIYNDINGEYKTISNQRCYIESICNYLDELIDKNNIKKEEILTVIDLTGGYEKEIVNTFYDKGYNNILLVEGLKVKNFNRSTKYNRAKTDKVDCFILAEYGKTFYRDLKLYKPMEDSRDLMIKIYNRIEDLKDLIKREKTRYKQPNINDELILKESIADNIEHLEKEVKRLKQYLLEEIIKKNKRLNLIYNTLLREKGIAEETALFLLVRIKELGVIERKQLTSICGLAPIANESGNFMGHRYIRGGRKDIRSKLFLCLMNMSRFDEEVKNRLNAFVNRGKSKKVALLSLARIKIVRINARVRDALLMEGL